MIGLNECQPDGIGGSNSSMGDSSTISTSSRGPGPGGGCEQLSARERALQTMEYYHNITNVRHNLGLASRKTNNGINPSTTYTSSGSIPRRHHLVQESLYRSNSSLELQDHHNNHQHHHLINENGTNAAPLRREYGSHGSIDVIASERNGVPPPGTTSEAFFAMLVDYRSAMLCAHAANDQRSPGPSEYLRTKGDTTDGSILTTASDDSVNADRSHPSNSSPKLRLKLNRLWGGNGTNGSVGSSTANNKGSRQTLQDDSILSTTSSNGVSTTSSDLEERQRRRAFAHHDCQSLTASLVYAVKLRGMLLARRRNTATGASAASMMTRASTPDAQVSGTDSGDEDNGDGQCNELIESCPFFRNEVGGEQARAVSLTRLQAPGSQSRSRPLHRPPLAYGVSVLEFASGETHWRSTACPYQRLSRPIESVDHGALYYRKYFYGQEHQNWFGIDEQLGPIAISIRRERIQPTESSSTSNSNNQYQYRLVIRTSELLTLRGAILEEAIPGLKSGGSGKTAASKEVLEHVAPEIQLPCLRLGIPNAESQLLKLDEQGLTSHYKVGIMYCKAGQASEEEMYNNEEAGPAFLEFLETIGQRVRLKGFDKYKAGLDNKTDSTGIYSVYSQYQDCEIMFHVSTYLPFTPNNRQQLLRKRHIGNDIVTIVFQEPGAQPFTPKNIRSQFQHVFLVVRAINPCSENTQYAIAVSRSKDVPVFGPPIRDGARFPKSKAFADFLLSKVINAENAAHRSEKFATMATRTRQEYLKDLATNYATTTLIDTGQKFSIFGGSKKKERTSRTGFIPDSCQRGAICWQVVLDDSGQAALVDSLLGISTDTFVLVEECSRQPVFVTPCSAILGWHAHGSSLRIYHHQGECTTIQMRETVGDRDELMEIVARLRAVTQACPVQELSLRRNPMGQLGFHVQPDGVVTQVESMGLAWQAGLRQGARLVEICKVAVSTLSHDQMVDLLKTSVLVTVTVVPALTDGSPRRGCTLQHCKFNAGNYESDYENVGDERRVAKAAQLQQAGNHRRRYDRSFSPPRSSNSSGYGTGSSSKSFYSKFPVNSEGTLTSSSSGRSSDDRWYEFLSLAEEKSLLIPETSENAIPRGATPPPLPARIHASSNSAFQSVTPKRSCENISQLTHCASQLQLSPSHQHSVSNHHTKVHSTHSLPLSNSNQSLSLAPRYLDFEAQDFKLNDKNCLKSPVNDSRPLPRTANIEYLVTRTPKTEYAAIHHLSSDSSAESVPTANDGHSTDTSSLSDRLLGIASEEDLSTDNSGNVSPKMRRSNKQQRNGNLTPTNGNSRNQSPRPSNGENTTRLRPGATRNPNNRNSANLSSTLQEDLMKLINPDYLSEDGLKEHEKNYYSNENGSKNERSSSKHSSKENIQKSLQNNGNNQTEVIFTMARPATVISNTSTASSPAPSEAKLSKEERLSPRVTNNAILKKSFLADSLILNESNDMDWTNLMDSATRGLLQNRADEQGSEHINGDSQEMRNGHWIDDRSEGSDRLVDSSLISTVSVPELQNHVCELESRVNRETRRRLSLEDEVRRLREENRRLQDESQAAAHQLRRFTEWFFQTIERQ